VKEAATVAKVLHIACPGDFKPYDPGASKLRLSPAGESDGVLTADQLSQMELTDCRLLALTGCETALGSASGADDLAGFPRAALEAGVRRFWGHFGRSRTPRQDDFLDRWWPPRMAR